jgi:hypothetical protein
VIALLRACWWEARPVKALLLLALERWIAKQEEAVGSA